jgi:hypothetical protein
VSLVCIPMESCVCEISGLTEKLRRAATCAQSPPIQSASRNQIVPRYEAAKRRRLQRGLARHPTICKTTPLDTALALQPRRDRPSLRRYDTAPPRASDKPNRCYLNSKPSLAVLPSWSSAVSNETSSAAKSSLGKSPKTTMKRAEIPEKLPLRFRLAR